MAGRPVPSVFESARKFFVAALGVAVLYAGIITDVIGEADFSTLEGIVGAVIALATALGVYGVRNEPS
jgi:hypothetical protein